MKDSINDISNQTIFRILFIILAFVVGIYLVITLRTQLGLAKDYPSKVEDLLYFL
jgi:hypothetical protein